jgi:hypothetical protein
MLIGPGSGRYIISADYRIDKMTAHQANGNQELRFILGYRFDKPVGLCRGINYRSPQTMASWAGPAGEQIDSPAMIVVHPSEWRILRARLASLLVTQGWTQTQVGRLFNLSQNSISEIINGVHE